MSASVVRPYTSGSRSPSRLRLGPCRTRIFATLRAYLMPNRKRRSLNCRSPFVQRIAGVGRSCGRVLGLGCVGFLQPAIEQGLIDRPQFRFQDAAVAADQHTEGQQARGISEDGGRHGIGIDADQDGIVDGCALHEGFGRRRLFHRDANHLRAVRGVLALELREHRHFLEARHAPTRPEIQQHHFAVPLGQGGGLARHVRQRVPAHRIADRKGLHAGRRGRLIGHPGCPAVLQPPAASRGSAGQHQNQDRAAVHHRAAGSMSAWTSALRTSDAVRTVGSARPSPPPRGYTTYSGTPGEWNDFRYAPISGSTSVQSPFMYTAPVCASRFLKPCVFNTAYSLALQVTHQSAPMSTNTGVSASRSDWSLVGLKAITSPFDEAVCEIGATRVTPYSDAAAAIASTSVKAWPSVRSGCRRACHHNAAASNTIAISTSATASAPRWCANTHISHTADRYIGNARICFSVSIQRPGFGSQRASAGTRPISVSGNARPTPSTSITSNSCAAGATKA